MSITPAFTVASGAGCPTAGGPPRDQDFLTPGRAAALCSVSTERFAGWMRQGLIPVIRREGRELIRTRDLIEHLLNHHIPIPEALLQGGRRKILFISLDERTAPDLAAQVIRLLYRLKEREDFIADFIRHSELTELKIISFAPELLVLLGEDEATRRLAERLACLLPPPAVIQRLSPDEAGEGKIDSPETHDNNSPAGGSGGKS